MTQRPVPWLQVAVLPSQGSTVQVTIVPVQGGSGFGGRIDMESWLVIWK